MRPTVSSPPAINDPDRVRAIAAELRRLVRITARDNYAAGVRHEMPGAAVYDRANAAEDRVMRLTDALGTFGDDVVPYAPVQLDGYGWPAWL